MVNKKQIDEASDVWAKVVDQMTQASILMSDKGYKLSTHEKQAEFAKKRNYKYDDDFDMDGRC